MTYKDELFTRYGSPSKEAEIKYYSGGVLVFSMALFALNFCGCMRLKIFLRKLKKHLTYHPMSDNIRHVKTKRMADRQKGNTK